MAIKGHQRSSVVVPIDAAHNYDFLLAPNSNLTLSSTVLDDDDDDDEIAYFTMR